MPRFRHKPSRAYLLKMSASGKKSQAVQAARRAAAITPEMLMDMLANPAPGAGDTVGAIQWTDFRAGKVTRWTVLRGNRVNNRQLRTPDGRTSKPHGWSWIMAKLRPIIIHS